MLVGRSCLGLPRLNRRRVLGGGLVGGLYGASVVPAEWSRQLHGWPGLRARDLVALGVMTARRPTRPCTLTDAGPSSPSCQPT